MGGIANNPQFQNAMQMARSIGQMPEQPGQPQVQPPYYPTGYPPVNDPLNRGGMPFQGFNPEGTDADPRRPFMGNPQPLMPQQPYNPQQLDAFKQMFQGQPPVQPPVQPQVMPQQPVPMPGQVRPPNMPFYRNPNPRTYGAVNNNGVTAQTPMPQQPQPANPQRGLGGLQIDKFRNRLG
jgi:hypothetical protein